MDTDQVTLSNSHLALAPSAEFWTKTLFFAKYDGLVAALTNDVTADAELTQRFSGGPALAVARAVIERAGGGLEAVRHLVLVGAFTEFKQSEAIEAVGLAVLGREVVADHRQPGGKVRRHAVMALLYEAAPEHLLAVSLWDRHLDRRRTHYRREPKLPAPIHFAGVDVGAAARTSLADLASHLRPSFSKVDEVQFVPCAASGEALVALREWPTRTTGRDPRGDVITVDVPDWAVIVFSHGGQRIEVSDRQVDRGARFAERLMVQLGAGDGRYDAVLDPLDDEKLDEFLERLTNPDDATFPLVEIVAEAPWRPHQTITLTGTATSTTEKLVGDLRTLHHPFARGWRTVRHVKFRFEKNHKILVHFPARGQPVALTFSDDNRGRAVTQRLIAFLKEHLHVDVASKARRGTTLPSRKERAAPRKFSARWWSEVLAPRTDSPAEWLPRALEVLAAEGLLVATWSRVFDCGSPYVDRRAAGVDSLDCDGVVEMPYDLPDHDRHQDEDDGEYTCSRDEHRWKAVRFGLPTVVSVKVEVVHANAWARLLREVSHFGEVHEVMGRPGVAKVRIDAEVRHLVYEPIVATRDELDPNNFGRREPAAWVVAPADKPPDAPVGALQLVDVLADAACLAGPWGGVALRRRKAATNVHPAPLAAAHDVTWPGAVAGVKVIELRPDGAWMKGLRLSTSNKTILVLDALRQAAAQDEADDRRREEWSWDRLDALLAPDDRGGKAAVWQTWVSRARKEISDGTGEPDLGKKAICGSGSYFLGPDFLIADRRLQAETIG